MPGGHRCDRGRAEAHPRKEDREVPGERCLHLLRYGQVPLQEGHRAGGKG